MDKMDNRNRNMKDNKNGMNNMNNMKDKKTDMQGTDMKRAENEGRNSTNNGKNCK